jgi:peptide-methionine (S)-S-oxide reductase
MTEKATFAAGCFWGVEEEFRKFDGVVDTAVGYEGGHTEKPSYKDVCTDSTGHAEVVQVEYDPPKISYQRLVELFFSAHDPTQVNRQGPDYGTQYRSAIFVHTPEQAKIASDTKAALDASGKFRKPIATEILPAQTFWRAEEYHQQYLAKRGMSHCHI